MNNMDISTLREVLKIELPRLLRENPEARYEIWGIMLESFPSRQEFNALHQELAAFRHETGEHFEKVENRIGSVEQRLDSRIDSVEQRIDSVEQNLGSRIDSVQQDIKGVEQRLDSRIDSVEQNLGSRIDSVEQRIDSVEQNLGSRIDSVEQNLGSRIDSVEQKMEQGFQDMRQHLDRLGGRWGIRNESIFRQTISALLEESFGARVETRVIKGEQFDLIISDGVHILVEITASAGPKMQKRLERKRQLYQEETGIEPARVILATASIHSRRAEALRQAGFEVIEPEEDETLED